MWLNCSLIFTGKRVTEWRKQLAELVREYVCLWCRYPRCWRYPRYWYPRCWRFIHIPEFREAGMERGKGERLGNKRWVKNKNGQARGAGRCVGAGCRICMGRLTVHVWQVGSATIQTELLWGAPRTWARLESWHSFCWTPVKEQYWHVVVEGHCFLVLTPRCFLSVAVSRKTKDDLSSFFLIFFSPCLFKL